MEKRHLILIIALLALSFGAYIYFNPPGNSSDVVTGDRTADTNDICMNYNNQLPTELPASLVREMIIKYQQNQLQSITANSLIPIPADAHSIWFDLDTLKKFIYEIEMNVQNKATSPGSKLGLRIYYAAYPLISKWSQPGYEALQGFLTNPTTMLYEKMHTVVMMPTIQSNNLYVDFNPADATSYGGFKSMGVDNPLSDSTFTRKILALMGTASGSSNAIEVRNHGQLIPPGDPAGEGL